MKQLRDTKAENRQQFFRNKTFFLDIRQSSLRRSKFAEVIRLFEGQIEQFLDRNVSYVLTDVPKKNWPPASKDSILESALSLAIKLMSAVDFATWCAKYIGESSSGDEDDENRPKVKLLKQPFIKIEDADCYYAPSVKELTSWPEVNLTTPLPIGCSVFSDPHIISTSNQSANNQTNQTPHLKRHHPFWCEICSVKIVDTIDNHVKTQEHERNIAKTDFKEIYSVITSISTFNMRLSNLKPPDDLQEFVCLHKVDSFLN